MGNQLVDAVRQGRNGTVDVALNPDELGRVRLSLSGSEGQLHVAIHADRPETQELLRRHIAQLQQDFRELGYTEVSFDFGRTSQDGGARDRPPQAETADSVPANMPTPDPAPALSAVRPLATATPSGLDLRL